MFNRNSSEPQPSLAFKLKEEYSRFGNGAVRKSASRVECLTRLMRSRRAETGQKKFLARFEYAPAPVQQLKAAVNQS